MRYEGQDCIDAIVLLGQKFGGEKSNYIFKNFYSENRPKYNDKLKEQYEKIDNSFLLYAKEMIKNG